MTIVNQIKQKIAAFPVGMVFSISDFGFDPSNNSSLAKALSRMAIAGELCKLSKGKYYKPKETPLGIIKPVNLEIVKEFLEKDGKIIGNITGPQAFASLGLTSQISSSIIIGTAKYRSPLKRVEHNVSFLKQDNPISEDNITLLRILDAVKMIRDIPTISPNEACTSLVSINQAHSKKDKGNLKMLSLAYTSYVSALAGAILEYVGASTDIVRKCMNEVSSYKLPISETILPNKSNWRINEPAR